MSHTEIALNLCSFAPFIFHRFQSLSEKYNLIINYATIGTVWIYSVLSKIN